MPFPVLAIVCCVILAAHAVGTMPDGGLVVLRGAWFARDAEVFGALIYGERLDPEVVDAFFSGLRFR